MSFPQHDMGVMVMRYRLRRSTRKDSFTSATGFLTGQGTSPYVISCF